MTSEGWWTFFEVLVFAAIPVAFFWSQLRSLRKLDEADEKAAQKAAKEAEKSKQAE
ncbi:MAG: hypothetical protein AAGI12_12245 [Pseudomonadota bacterium]